MLAFLSGAAARRRAIDWLNTLDDHVLRDLGIEEPSQIEDFVRFGSCYPLFPSPITSGDATLTSPPAAVQPDGRVVTDVRGERSSLHSAEAAIELLGRTELPAWPRHGHGGRDG